IHLVRNPEAVVELLSFVDRRRRRRYIEPLVRVEGIRVLEDARFALHPVVACREPEPHLVPLERATEGFVEIEVVDDFGWRWEAGCLRVVREVVWRKGGVGEG